MNKPIASKAVCNTLAIAIYEIEYGIEDYVTARYVGTEKPQRMQKRKIIYEDDRPYFKLYGNREYLDEYIRL